MPSVDFRLYLVTDRQQTAGRPLVSVVGRAVSAGVRAVQLRERDLPIRELLSLALDLQRELSDMQLFINDRVDLAVALGCRGAHLRESSLPAPVVRTLLQPSQLLGLSVHSIQDAVAAERHGADFVVLGPIYDTPSKREHGAPLGLQVLEQAARAVKPAGSLRNTALRSALKFRYSRPWWMVQPPSGSTSNRRPFGSATRNS